METAVPARRAGVFPVPLEGGDVLVKVCEGFLETRARTAEDKDAGKKPNGKGGDDEDLDDDSEEEEEEEIREQIWRVGNVLAEAGLGGVSKGGKVEVTVSVGTDLGVQITAREVKGKGGVRGVLEARRTEENGVIS